MTNIYKNKTIGSSVLAIAAATLVASIPSVAHAETEAQASSGFGDIVVTARKRSEDLLKTPVAIAAFDSEGLEKKGLVSVSDIAVATPGINVNSNNSGRNDRSFQQVIIRGFVPSNAQNPTVSTFIDGVPVSSPTAFNAVTDPERVEMMRGPQSAYFGRGTFAGAMNVVTKEPGEEFGGQVSAMVGTRGNYRVQAMVEGPILEDVLSFRVSANQFEKNGSYKNAFSGETLGDQKSRGVSGQIVAKPVDDLKIKLFGMYSQDRDGAPANAMISAYDLYDRNGNLLVKGQSNCSFNAGGTNVPFMCGTLSMKDLSLPMSANTHDTAYIKDFVTKPNGRLTSTDLLDGFGLGRNYYHLHANVDYEIGDTGLTVSSLTGMNREEYAQFSDMDLYGSTNVPNTAGNIAGGAPAFYDYSFLVERKTGDFSQELRLAYDNGGALQLTTGLSYLNNWSQGGNGGGPANLNNINSRPAGKAQSRTRGAFISGTYKFDNGLSISADGRYQVDTLYAYTQPGGLNIPTSELVPAGRYEEGDLLLRKTYKNFLPRVIAQYDFGREAMVYASWAKGVSPAQFNTGFLIRSAPAVEEGIRNGIGIEAQPEKVTNYEIGVKGRLLDGNLNYSLAGYFAQWRDQANLLAIQFVHQGELPPGATGAVENVNGQVNTGEVDMKGIELDVNWRASDLITFGFSGAFNDSDIKKFTSINESDITGIKDFSGKEMPFFSKWSGTANVEFAGDVKGFDDGRWFARADYIYKSGIWSDRNNIAKTQDAHKVNLRAGISNGPISIEAFVTNLFNNKSFTALGNHYLYAPSNAYNARHSALAVGLPELRTVGVQMKYKF